MTRDIEILDTQGSCDADVAPCFLPFVVLFSIAANENRARGGPIRPVGQYGLRQRQVTRSVPYGVSRRFAPYPRALQRPLPYGKGPGMY